VRWAEFEIAAPELAALGRERIERFGFVFLGTIRKDGGPRINPVEAHFVGEELAHALMKGSVKARDLLRDSRAYLHTPVLDWERGTPGEFKVRARALAVDDASLRDAIAEAVERRGGYRPPDDWHFFTIDVESAAFHDYLEAEDVHRFDRWTRERGYEPSKRTIT
jgi:hypothetical protein